MSVIDPSCEELQEEIAVLRRVLERKERELAEKMGVAVASGAHAAVAPTRRNLTPDELRHAKSVRKVYVVPRQGHRGFVTIEDAPTFTLSDLRARLLRILNDAPTGDDGFRKPLSPEQIALELQQDEVERGLDPAPKKTPHIRTLVHRLREDFRKYGVNPELIETVGHDIRFRRVGSSRPARHSAAESGAGNGVGHATTDAPGNDSDATVIDRNGVTTSRPLD